MKSSCQTKTAALPNGTTTMIGGLGVAVLTGAIHLASGAAEPTTALVGAAWACVAITTIGLIRALR